MLGEKDYKDKMKAFTPDVLRNGGETKFRSYFQRLYPSFLVRLKELVQEPTRNEEILCMLIKLGQSSDDIAQILCISKSSVNMARHRLRKKMDLKKEDSLEEILLRL